jgi:hypothetical protein
MAVAETEAVVAKAALWMKYSAATCMPLLNLLSQTPLLLLLLLFEPKSSC